MNIDLIPGTPGVIPAEVAAFIKGDKGDKGDTGNTGGVTPELEQLLEDSQAAAGEAAVQAATSEAAKDISVSSSTASAASASAALGSAQAAQNSAISSELSASVAAALAHGFLTTADGLANTSGTGATNRLFSVPSTADSLAIAYRNDAGVAVEIGRSPSTALVQGIGIQLAGQYPAEFRAAPALTGVPENTSRTRIEGTLFKEAGYLKQVTVYAETAGTAKVKVVRKTGALSYSFISEFAVTLAVGINVFNVGTHFFSINVTTDDTIAVATFVGRTSLTSTGPAASSLIFPGDLTGANQVVTSTVNVMQIQAVVGVGLSYSQLIASANQLSGTQATYNVVPPASGATENASRTRIAAATFAAAGEMKSVSVYAMTAGTGKIKLLNRISEGVYGLSQEFAVTCVVGVNTFVGGVHYPLTNVAAGNALGFYGITARPACVTAAAGSSYIYAGDLLGASVAAVADAYVLQIGAVVETVASLTSTSTMAKSAYNNSVANAQAIAALNPVSMPQVSNALRGKLSVLSEAFPGSVTPTLWTLAGGVWTVANALKSTGAGAVTAVAYYGNSSIASRKVTRARIRFTDSTSNFGLQWRPPRGTRGTTLMVNGAAGTLTLSLFTGSTVTLSKSVALAAALVAGRDYVLTAKKDGISTVCTLVDTVTQATTTITQSQGDGSPDAGAQHGKPGFMHMSGTVEVIKIDVITQCKQAPYITIIGDSISEGSDNGASWASCWPYLVDAERAKGDLLLSAKGGNTTTDALDCCAADLDPFSPTYVILAVGTNDVDQAAFRTNYAALIARALARAAIPILVTQVPRPARQAQVTAQNLDITSGYFGSYRIINMATALGGPDGTVFNSAYYVGDGVHPNATGHLLMRRQVEIDFPEAFE
jgi:lysophospholipase L1-like esterase